MTGTDGQTLFVHVGPRLSRELQKMAQALDYADVPDMVGDILQRVATLPTSEALKLCGPYTDAWTGAKER